MARQPVAARNHEVGRNWRCLRAPARSSVASGKGPGVITTLRLYLGP
jgi:hypothetical protein